MENTKKVIIDKERCKGCRLCIEICPIKIIELSDNTNSHGYNPAQVIDLNKCISCGNCAQICPDLAIEVFKEN
ncbi:MAG: 4Fe-4S binding protein [bacterium]